METQQTQGAAGAQGSGAAAGGAGAAQQGSGQQQDAGQKTTGAQQQGAQGADGKTTDKAQGAGDTSQAKPTAFVPKLPEGMKLDEAVLGEFNSIVDDAKMSPAERKQKLIDLQVKQFQAAERAYQDTLSGKPARDLETLKTDKDFGGANFQKTIDGAKRIERLAFGDELGKLLKPLGMDSDPVILKGLARLSRVIAEDSVGSKTGDAVETDADAEGRKQFPKSWDDMKRRSARK